LREPGAGPRNLAWLGAIILVSLNLRAVITSVPPLALDLSADLHLSGVATGALTTVPVVCMGLFAPVAAWATRRWPESAVLSAGMALIAVGGAARGGFGVVGLFAATAVAGIGIAVAGTLLPGRVRTVWPGPVGPVTGLYTAALIGGSHLASALAVPVRGGLGVSSQASLAVWAAPAVVALAVWWLVARGAPAPTGPAGGARLPWRDPAAWLGTGFMGAQSVLFYGTLAWLAASDVEQGMSSRDAGLMLGLFGAAQVVSALAVPALAHRTGDLRPWCVVSVGTATVGLVLVALAPDVFAAAPWLWATVLGLGMGGNLSLALTAITHLAPTPAEAPAYTGMAFLFGYLIAAIGPVLLGLLVDLTGGYRVPFLTLAAVGLVAITLGVRTAARAQSAHRRSSSTSTVGTTPGASRPA
jgi:CP family cyanate transporter-like MFS transporter